MVIGLTPKWLKNLLNYVGDKVINIVKPQIGLAEQQEVMKVLESGMLAAGEWVEQFERDFASYLDIPFGVATSSGTTALHALMEALGLQKGDKVLTTPFSFVASANAILYCGAQPIFVDIDPTTYNICPKALAKTIRQHPDAKAVLVVHIFGLPAEMKEICDLTQKYNLLLIEDCAQAHGAEYQGRKVGTFGVASAFSFYPTKNMTCGEGGMVVTSDRQLARRVARIINHGQLKRYHHHWLGYNFRLTNIHAAIGIQQLKKLDQFNKQRIANAEFYRANIQNENILLPCQPQGCKHVYHQFTLQVAQRDQFLSYLQQQQIGCAVHYPILIPHQQFYKQRFSNRQNWPMAEKLCSHCVSIPVYPGLTTDQRQYITEAVNNYA